MATQQNVDKLLKLIEETTEVPVASLIHSPDWGKLNFEDIEEDLKKLFEMLNHLKILPLNLLPDAEISKIISGLNEPKKTIDAIKKFDIEQANAKGTRDSYARSIKTQIDTFYIATHLWIPYLAYQKGDVQKNIESLNDSVKKASIVLEQTKEDVKSKKAELEDVVQAAKEASASVGVSHFSSNFKKEADDLEKSANKWLTATIILAIATFLITLLSYWVLEIPKDSSTAQIVQILSTKLILITVFFTATLWSGKMYRAIMHQVTINKHRANALLTFQAFVKATNDNNIRDAVLMETTKSIFSISPSGYIDNDQSSSQQTNVVEIIKSSIDKIGKSE
jgi:flagellar hook-basal body complex protein FliE